MAESLFGASRGARDVIQVVIDHNVGAGVITDGRLLHAGSSSLVEIAHTQVDPYGKRCYCGNHGCLETIASVESVLELAQIRMAKSMSSMLHQQPLSVEWLCQAALQGDLLARDIISGVGNHVGRIWRLWLTSLTRRKSLSALPSISPRIFCFRQYLIVFDNNRYQPTADILPWKAPSFLTGERWLARPW
ncbi:transcriptional regulator Mic [Klebsiella michiganensis]|uniref:Transcriptional regulator Mic n=1 Tax=Klebsiella michiganensis TaxID=1134687 RepID=A0A7H4PM67_9ENTR|nr:transcriptional regulator Mic [Klebsiella michiganensis]